MNPKDQTNRKVKKCGVSTIITDTNKMKNEKNAKTIAYHLKAGLQMRQFGLDHGIYDHERKQIFMLNPIAGLIFNYLPTGKTYDEIVENIVIACGKSTAKPDEIMKDLEKTVEELISLELVEPIQSSGYFLKDPLIISENEMTSLSIPYMPPQIKAYSMEDLLKKYRRNNDQKFGDTWNPDTGNVRFSDTWNPDTGNVRFSDTWNPGTGNVRFSDTWNPDTGNVRFSDTWNPTQGKTNLSEKGRLESKLDKNNKGTPGKD